MKKENQIETKKENAKPKQHILDKFTKPATLEQIHIKSEKNKFKMKESLNRVVLFFTTKIFNRREKKMQILKVSSKSEPQKVAGSIAAIMQKEENVGIQAIGGGAINQSIKAVAIARGFLAPCGIDLICRPAFLRVLVGGNERTAIQLNVAKVND